MAAVVSKPRTKPNILVTGTPGTGKTTTAQVLAQKTGFSHICVGDIVKQKKLHDSYNEEFDTYMLDEDKVVDELEDALAAGGTIVDFHSCDFFPERWFDLVVVLRTSNDVLHPRLQKRGYKENKIAENVEAEIMQVCLDEARDSYVKEIVIELQSNTIQQLNSNVERMALWIQNYMKRSESKQDE